MKVKKNVIIYLALMVPLPVLLCLLVLLVPSLLGSGMGTISGIVHFFGVFLPLVFLGILSLPMVLEKLIKMRWVSWLKKHHFDEVISFINWMVFFVPLTLVMIHSGMVYGSFEASISLMFLLVFSSFFVPSWIILHVDRCAIYPVITNMICSFIFGILGLFNPFFLPLGFFNSVSTWVSLKTRRLKPRKREFSAIITPVVIGLIISTPFIMFDNESMFSTDFTIPAEPVPGVFNIDWTWADDYDNPQGMNDSVLDALAYCNALENINVSVTVALPEEYINNFSANEIRKLLDRKIPVNIMLLLPKEPNYFYINDFTIDHYSRVTYPLFKQWVLDNNFSSSFLSIILDLEPLIRDYSAIFLSSYNVSFHQHAVHEMEKLIEEMKDDFGSHGTKVIGATFGYFLDDFIDLDDSIFRFLALATCPPSNWDAMGFMCYEHGEYGDYSLYILCKGIDHYFGNLGIPYIISKQSFNETLKKFMIIRNYGFDYAGIWALQDFLEREDEAGFNSTQRLIDLHEALNEPGIVTFKRTDLDPSYIHSGLLLADLLFWDWPARTGGRLMGMPVR
ncbi:MAG: hypothetical protein ACTSVI_05830 [Promethearchaeota archaeon]